jgi:hypothetical protein
MKITISGQAYALGVFKYGPTRELGEPEWHKRGASGRQAHFDVTPELAVAVRDHFLAKAAELGRGDKTDRIAGRALALAADRINERLVAEAKRERAEAREMGTR